jgi:hypothetical protein
VHLVMSYCQARRSTWSYLARSVGRQDKDQEAMIAVAGGGPFRRMPAIARESTVFAFVFQLQDTESDWSRERPVMSWVCSPPQAEGKSKGLLGLFLILAGQPSSSSTARYRSQQIQVQGEAQSRAD